MKIAITSLQTIAEAAREFIADIGDRRVFAFYGAMGAGKTTFIKAVCEELGVKDQVTSPTFAIVNEYSIDHSPLTIDHSPLTIDHSPLTIDHSPLTIDHSDAQPMVNGQCLMFNVQRVFHFDFYRIKRLEEAYDMGCEEYFYSGNLCFIEWPELIEDLLPEDTVRVTITQHPDGHRTVTL